MSSNQKEHAQGPGAARGGYWLTATAGLATVLLLWSSWREPEPASDTVSLQTERLTLSPQECVTECQARQTDCIQACEGRVSCEKECVVVGEGCVARCRHAGDAGAARSPGAAASPALP